MITNILLIALVFFVAILPFASNDKVECIYKLEEDSYTFFLKEIRYRLKNNIRVLNNYLQNENVDEECLVQLIENIEIQIEDINDLLTNYGKLKKASNDEVKRI